MVDAPEEADVVVHAHGLSSPTLPAVVEAARSAGRPLVIFSNSDDATPADPAHVGHGTLWRTSIHASRRRPFERAMPAPVADFGPFEPLPHRSTPGVAFLGYVGTPLQRLTYRLTGRTAKAEGLSLRAKALGRLEAADGIECNFGRLTKFAGGIHELPTAEREAARTASRERFHTNMAGSPYTLCLRGAGNFSYRLYEVFSRGRIPLYVDTDTVLPFADEIDYVAHMPIARSVAELPDVLRRWHASHDDESFAEVQRANRRLFTTYFEPAAFYARVLQAATDPSPVHAGR